MSLEEKKIWIHTKGRQYEDTERRRYLQAKRKPMTDPSLIALKREQLLILNSWPPELRQ